MARTVNVIETLRYGGVSIYMNGLALNMIEAFICIDIMPAALAAPLPSSACATTLAVPASMVR
jgi:hypothetical protein